MLEPGALVIQRYQIVRLIGRGGMGAVYEAVDQRLRNTVALKQMIGTSMENAEAFQHEAQLLAALRHPALPKVIDYFSDNANWFLVMEFFTGADLAALQARRGGPFPLHDILDWADQLLAALEYLHTRTPPVLHRDIKPQNLKLTPDGQIVLLDFGLARGTDQESSFFGYTLQYAPLEQIDASGTDPRSDLYALAATLYHLMTDRIPPNAPARAEALLAGRPDPLRPLTDLHPEVSPELSNIFTQALAVHRENRPASALALRQALRQAAVQIVPTSVGDAASVSPRSLRPITTPGSGAERPLSIGWEQVRDAAGVQCDYVLRELQGSARRLGPYLPEAYVARSIETDLADFLAGPAGALLILGDSGVGKTCLLAQWASELRRAGDAVLFYRCGGSLGPEIDREIARDLRRELPELLLGDLNQIAQLATAAQRRLVIIFDGLNEYRSGAQAGPEALLKQIDSLVGRVAGPHLRMVISCNSATWNQLDRAGATNLFWGSYYYSSTGESALTLDLFEPLNLALAYERYRRFFQLQTPLESLPLALRERLRKPLLMRMIAESYRDGAVVLAARGLSLGIFRRFFDERVRQRREQLFIEELAAEMLRLGQAAVPIRDLVRNDQLRPDLLSDDPDSAYTRLLDGGVLCELSGNLFSGEMVGFSYAEVGAYVLARHILRAGVAQQGITSVMRGLLAQARSFPLAWEVARTALLIYHQPDGFTALAELPDVEPRELVVETLLELYADEPNLASEIIKQLCQRDSEEARRTGLKAAYYIGPRAREIFLWAAAKGKPALRRVARDVLYLIWHNDPDFTYGLLKDLVGRVGPAALRDLRNIVEFFFELSVVIYINHCHRQDVIDRTVDLYYELAKQRLHLDIINTGIFGKTVEDLIFQAVANAFSQPILDTIMLAEVMPIEQFFALPKSERALLIEAAPLFDPATPLGDHIPTIEALLHAPNIFFNLVGVAQLGIHAASNFTSSEPIIRDLFERLPGPSRLWVLLSFSVLMPQTPPAWAALIEHLTERLFSEHADLVYGETPSILNQLDILLVPLGLAYGKVGQTMPVIELLIQDGLLRGDDRQIARCVAGLAAVGFYHPTPTFRLLSDLLTALEPSAYPDTLITTLATIRTLHLDAADVFMQRAGLSAEYQRQVAAAADTELVRRFIYWLGMFNQVVHSCTYYPKIRRQMAMAAMEMLTNARQPSEFIAAYTANVFRMLREAGFRLSEWTT
ncbi:serine/threonine protein kinase [Oscillochloris trichoides DG-6]|uniref:Serine/threonine protein kinase n=1 Tax=Oscillochloris trichoides DG-6 TaxID=765420 RepID=E1IBF0_9CHLR|nr:protein kinase [Oscillochloris trichoides]EFO81507.1 serine/threonine protein kinase [Oscillochloris trichoides DG-6]